MEKEIELFRDNVDAWIKEIRSELSELRKLPRRQEIINTHLEHNSETIEILKIEIEELKKELNLLKLSHILMLKEKED